MSQFRKLISIFHYIIRPLELFFLLIFFRLKWLLESSNYKYTNPVRNFTIFSVQKQIKITFYSHFLGKNIREVSKETRPFPGKIISSVRTMIGKKFISRYRDNWERLTGRFKIDTAQTSKNDVYEDSDPYMILVKKLQVNKIARSIQYPTSFRVSCQVHANHWYIYTSFSYDWHTRGIPRLRAPYWFHQDTRRPRSLDWRLGKSRHHSHTHFVLEIILYRYRGDNWPDTRPSAN